MTPCFRIHNLCSLPLQPPDLLRRYSPVRFLQLAVYVAAEYDVPEAAMSQAISGAMSEARMRAVSIIVLAVSSFQPYVLHSSSNLTSWDLPYPVRTKRVLQGTQTRTLLLPPFPTPPPCLQGWRSCSSPFDPISCELHQHQQGLR